RNGTSAFSIIGTRATTTAGFWSAYRCHLPTRRHLKPSWMAWAIPTGMSRRTRPTPSSFDPAVGLELEMVVAHAATGYSLPVTHYFDALNNRLRARLPAAPPVPVLLDDRCVALTCEEGE